MASVGAKANMAAQLETDPNIQDLGGFRFMDCESQFAFSLAEYPRMRTII